MGFLDGLVKVVGTAYKIMDESIEREYPERMRKYDAKIGTMENGRQKNELLLKQCIFQKEKRKYDIIKDITSLKQLSLAEIDADKRFMLKDKIEKMEDIRDRLSDEIEQLKQKLPNY